MYKSKYDFRRMVAIVIFFTGLTAFIGCDNSADDFNNLTKKKDNSLVGKWVTTDNHAGSIDEITFTKELRVLGYFDYIFANQTTPSLYLPPYVSYSLSDDKITFTIHYSYPTEENCDETFEYVLKDNVLTIKGFSNPFSATLEARHDIRFTKKD